MANGERRPGDALADRMRERSDRARDRFDAAMDRLTDGDWETPTTPQLIAPLRPSKPECVVESDPLPTSLIPGIRRVPKKWRMFALGFCVAGAGFSEARWAALSKLLGLD